MGSVFEMRKEPPSLICTQHSNILKNVGMLNPGITASAALEIRSSIQIYLPIRANVRIGWQRKQWSISQNGHFPRQWFDNLDTSGSTSLPQASVL